MGYTWRMQQANWIIFLHFLALWGSVITSLAATWRLPVPLAVAMPLGAALWACGFLVNVYAARQPGPVRPSYRSPFYRSSGRRIFARTIMNLGIALFFRAWLTIAVALVLVPLYALAAQRRRLYLDYMRTGMLSDAFPDRINRHWGR